MSENMQARLEAYMLWKMAQDASYPENEEIPAEVCNCPEKSR